MQIPHKVIFSALAANPTCNDLFRVFDVCIRGNDDWKFGDFMVLMVKQRVFLKTSSQFSF